MVATLLKFNHRRATVATLPALLLSIFDEFFCRGIVGTVPRCMHFVVTDAAYPSRTMLTFPYLTTVLHEDMIWLDPLTAATIRTVYSIPRGIFLKLPIPGFLEFLIKQFVYVPEWNVI